MKDYMHVSIYEKSNYMSKRDHFKNIGTFQSKQLLIPSHETRNAIDDLKNNEMFCTLLYRIFCSKQEVSILQNG